jgi:hypothetical protein
VAPFLCGGSIPKDRRQTFTTDFIRLLGSGPKPGKLSPIGKQKTEFRSQNSEFCFLNSVFQSSRKGEQVPLNILQLL